MSISNEKGFDPCVHQSAHTHYITLQILETLISTTPRQDQQSTWTSLLQFPRLSVTHISSFSPNKYFPSSCILQPDKPGLSNCVTMHNNIIGTDAVVQHQPKATGKYQVLICTMQHGAYFRFLCPTILKSIAAIALTKVRGKSCREPSAIH